jgi:Protein of Unknown function (DUF2784)
VGFRLLLWFAVGTHFAFLAYGVFGGFLSWRWPRTIGLHLAAALWLFAIVAFSWKCPLTWLEDRSREQLGLPTQVGGFLNNHVAGVFYPHGYERAAQLVVALIVLTSWIGLAVVLLHRRASAGKPGVRAR